MDDELNETVEESDDENDEIDETELEKINPSPMECLESLQTVRRFCQHEGLSANIFDRLQEIENQCLKKHLDYKNSQKLNIVFNNYHIL